MAGLLTSAPWRPEANIALSYLSQLLSKTHRATAISFQGLRLFLKSEVFK
jgi:hypothetical protein